MNRTVRVRRSVTDHRAHLRALGRKSPAEQGEMVREYELRVRGRDVAKETEAERERWNQRLPSIEFSERDRQARKDREREAREIQGWVG